MASASATAEANKALFLEKVSIQFLLQHDQYIFEVVDSSAHIQQVFADSVDDNDCQDGFGKKKNMTDKIAMMLVQVRESNTACQAGDFEKAVGLYTEAIALDKCNHILYSNRLDYS